MGSSGSSASSICNVSESGVDETKKQMILDEHLDCVKNNLVKEINLNDDFIQKIQNIIGEDINKNSKEYREKIKNMILELEDY